jgi:hypothetical protein
VAVPVAGVVLSRAVLFRPTEDVALKRTIEVATKVSSLGHVGMHWGGGRGVSAECRGAVLRHDRPPTVG